MARCQKTRQTTPLSPRNLGSRPKPPEPSDTCPSHWRECRRCGNGGHHRPAACPRGRFPRLHRARSTDNKQQGKKKTPFFLVAVLFPRIRLSLVDPPKPSSTAKPLTPQISPLRLPPSGIQTPRRQPCKKRASIRRPGKVNLQASAAAARAATTEGTSIAEWMGGEGRGATPCMMQCACFCVACRPSVVPPPPLPKSLNISSERHLHISKGGRRSAMNNDSAHRRYTASTPANTACTCVWGGTHIPPRLLRARGLSMTQAILSFPSQGRQSGLRLVFPILLFPRIFTPWADHHRRE